MVTVTLTRPKASSVVRVELQSLTANSKKDWPPKLCIKQAVLFLLPRMLYVPVEWVGAGHHICEAEQFGRSTVVVIVLVPVILVVVPVAVIVVPVIVLLAVVVVCVADKVLVEVAGTTSSMTPSKSQFFLPAA